MRPVHYKSLGPGDALDYIGDIHLTDARLHVNYTRCTYHIPSAMVHMRADQIDFGSFQIVDSLGNTAESDQRQNYFIIRSGISVMILP